MDSPFFQRRSHRHSDPSSFSTPDITLLEATTIVQAWFFTID
jgi:hypothetical protein